MLYRNSVAWFDGNKDAVRKLAFHRMCLRIQVVEVACI